MKNEIVNGGHSRKDSGNNICLKNEIGNGGHSRNDSGNNICLKNDNTRY